MDGNIIDHDSRGDRDRITAEQPDEADTVSATPAFPVKSMTLSNDTFLYFVSDDPSFRRSYWDENDDYLNDSVQLILRTTLAAQEFDDVWIVYTETNPTFHRRRSSGQGDYDLHKGKEFGLHRGFAQNRVLSGGG